METDKAYGNLGSLPAVFLSYEMLRA